MSRISAMLQTLCTSPSSAVVRSVNDTLRVYHGLVQRYPASNTWHFLSWSQVDMFVSAIHALVLTSDAEAMSERYACTRVRPYGCTAVDALFCIACLVQLFRQLRGDLVGRASAAALVRVGTRC